MKQRIFTMDVFAVRKILTAVWLWYGLTGVCLAMGTETQFQLLSGYHIPDAPDRSFPVDCLARCALWCHLEPDCVVAAFKNITLRCEMFFAFGGTIEDASWTILDRYGMVSTVAPSYYAPEYEVASLPSYYAPEYEVASQPYYYAPEYEVASQPYYYAPEYEVAYEPYYEYMPMYIPPEYDPYTEGSGSGYP